MKIKKIILMVSFMISVGGIFAAEVKREGVNLDAVYSISKDKINMSERINTMLLKLPDGNWTGSTNCSGTYVVVQKEDNHLVSLILTGVTTGKSFDIWVDSSLQPYGDDKCQATQIKINY